MPDFSTWTAGQQRAAILIWFWNNFDRVTAQNPVYEMLFALLDLMNMHWSEKTNLDDFGTGFADEVYAWEQWKAWIASGTQQDPHTDEDWFLTVRNTLLLHVPAQD